MTLPDADTRGKPVRRRWLFGPYILLLVVAIAWTAGWFWLKLSATRELEQTAERLRTAGYQVSWSSREIGGYPFRLNVRLTEARIGEPSGWALTFPELKTEAAVYALRQWTLVAPQGVVMARPQGGPVAIRGQLLRASVSEPDRRPPHIIVEGVKLTFTPQAGGGAYPLSAADRLVMELRPGPDDQTALLFRAENATARFTGLLARIAQDRPVSLNWESILSRTSAFDGPNWPGAAQAWTAAGGAINVRNASVRAGDALVEAKSGALTVGSDGRLQGALEVDLRAAPSVSPEAALAAAIGGGVAQATIAFEAGQTMLGPVAVGPSPRVY